MPQSAYEYLASHELLTVATASADGVPHASPVFYVSDGPVVWFSTADNTQTGQNLAANPYASIAVADAPDPGEDWSHARGLQIWGPVTRLDGEQRIIADGAFHRCKLVVGFLDNAILMFRNGEISEEQLQEILKQYEKEFFENYHQIMTI